MRRHNRASKITVMMLSVLAGLLPAWAWAVEFTARVDRGQITLDDSVALKLTLESETGGRMEPPRFNAPGFDIINEYSSTYVESYFDSTRNHFGAKNRREFTKVLKPQRTGTFAISGIEVTLDGTTYRAPSITVQVVAGGAGTPPPRGYGGSGSGLRGAGKRQTTAPFFVRAEVSKQKIFKGEQIIVSYYLYTRARTYNIEVTKYPELNGFLREDLEMPVVGQNGRMTKERVVLDGVTYDRALLVRYAAYPLKEGKLTIDSMGIRANYYSNEHGDDEGMGDLEDEIFSFFRQMTPKQFSSKNDVLQIEVLPLPAEGKPDGFSGGIGDFNVTSAVNRYEVRANEAVELTVKVEGSGNVASIQDPKTAWPQGVDLYESKARSQGGKAGIGEKVFQYLLIPRQPGKLTLPPVEFDFFDPGKQQYVRKASEPIEINVGEPLPGTTLAAPAGVPQQAVSPDAAPRQELAPIRPPAPDPSSGQGIDFGRTLLALAWAGLLAFGGWVGFDQAMSWRRRRSRDDQARALRRSKSWQSLRERAKSAAHEAKWPDVTQAYEALSGAVYDALDRVYGLGARSHSRGELREMLVGEQGLSEPLWERINQLLEFAETVRFATSAGAVSESAARSQLAKWVLEGEAIDDALRRNEERLTNR